MEHQVGDIITAKVVQTRPYALFLELEDGARGLLHISEISDGYIRDIEKFGVAGDEIKVKIIEVDPNNGFLRFSYKQIPEGERYTSHDANSKIIPQIDTSGFDLLAEKLPQWIEETLKKASENND